MRTFGSNWKEASINGKVVSITKNTWRVEWCIGRVGVTLNHGKSFWKSKKTPLSGNGADAGCTSIATNPRQEDIIEEEEEDNRNEDIQGRTQGGGGGGVRGVRTPPPPPRTCI